MDAFKALLQSVNPDQLHFNPDSAIDASKRANIIVIRDDEPPQVIYEPIGVELRGYQQSVPIEVFVFDKDPDRREETMDTMLMDIDQALVNDPFLGGLIEGRTYTRPEFETTVAENKMPHKRAEFSIEFEYISQTPLS